MGNGNCILYIQLFIISHWKMIKYEVQMSIFWNILVAPSRRETHAVTSSALESSKTSCILNVFLKNWNEMNVTGGVSSPNVKVLVLIIEKKYFFVYWKVNYEKSGIKLNTSIFTFGDKTPLVKFIAFHFLIKILITQLFFKLFKADEVTARWREGTTETRVLN